jgi:hypothetical protein
MLFPPSREAPYILTQSEETDVRNIFGDSMLEWAKNNVYWGDTKDNTAIYSYTYEIVVMSNKVSHDFLSIARVLAHELTHRQQHLMGGMASGGTYTFTTYDLQVGKLDNEQVAEAVRMYAMYLHRKWNGDTVLFNLKEFKLNATLASYFYKVLDKLGLKNYKRPTF